MKVLFILNTLTNYFSSLLSQIATKGIEISIVIPENNTSKSIGSGVKSAENLSDGIKIIYGKERTGFYGKQKYENLKDIIKESQCDTVVFIWPYYLQLYWERGILQYIQSKGIKLVFKDIPFLIPPYGKPEYFLEHPVYDENMNLISNNWKFKLRTLFLMHVRRYLYSRVDATLNYTSLANKILPSYGVNEEKIFVTYNSSDTNSLLKEKEQIKTEPNLLEDKLRVIHIGRLVKWKRVDLLIDAFYLVLRKIPDVELLIIGDGPELENLKNQAEKLDIKDSIRFAGAVYDSLTLGKYMSESSIYVLAGMGGLSINDAMTFGLPVICSVCDGTEKDLVKDGMNGYFFKEGDKDDLKEKMISLLKDEPLRREFGKFSSKVIEETININIVANRYIDAFITINNKNPE